MKHILFVLLASISIIDAHAQSTTYYICDCAANADINCIAGNDANNGTSASTPWRTTTKVASVITSFHAGDSILFAKGGSWINAHMRIYNFNSRRDNPIVFDSYTPAWGGTAKPILKESRTFDGLFDLSDGGNVDHDEGYIIRNLNLRGGAGSTCLRGIFLFNDVDYVRIENMDIDSIRVGVGISKTNGLPLSPGADRKSQNVSLLNSRITNCFEQGFLGGGDSMLIQGCYFENNGSADSIKFTSRNHNIYASGGNNVIIRNNELYRSAFCTCDGKAEGGSLTVHGLMANLLIEGNYVHEDVGNVGSNGWGIAVNPAYAISDGPEGFPGLIIRGNKLVNMYNTGISFASCPGAIIENNIIFNDNAVGVVAICAPGLNRDVTDSMMTRVTIRNNSIYLRQATVDAVGIKMGGEGTGHSIISNIISLDKGNCINLGLPNSAYTTVDYNMGELLGGATWSSGQSLSAWRTASGFDMQSLIGDPMFVSPGSPNYNLELSSVSSPAVNAGHPSQSASTDFNGLVRAGVPDCGAYEYIIPTAQNEITNTENSFNVYPNPTNGQFTIELELNAKAQIIICNTLGETIYNTQAQQGKQEINISDFANGIYILKVFNNEQQQYVRIVKQ
ncbi:MAG: T9SS type A sorting domain-containing protein [Bacteroidetes bacterium]|nr:T9SS type A sorting domain-containing protein [Bacteroidota bacterium]